MKDAGCQRERAKILSVMQSAIGRTRSLTDYVDPARAVALHGALGCDGRPPGEGDELPPFWHHIYFWEPVRPEETGKDGHPKTGAFIPELGLPKRMWAGGQVKFGRSVKIGEPACKSTVISGIERKAGRSGPLAFVHLKHLYSQHGDLAIEETQTLVYRSAEPESPRRKIPPAPYGETVAISRSFNSSMLFRFSALTFNGHRIHYDADYCRAFEGYPSQVVHGPLLALLLANLARSSMGSLNSFTYRAIAPLFANEEAEFCFRGSDGVSDSWVRGPNGRLCMSALAE
ncbi:MAG: acyl dehydratase [Albidovulum sp.]|nr:acyl dehydratase [Albidovulum sp.]MDE0530389.1 acyl dehydratase [Albidovulum sp.]